jgi:hypothetical protein
VADEPIVFTRPAAQRIAAAVRKVEGGDKDGGGLEFERVWEGGSSRGRALHVCTFTGSWSINEPKTLTFQGITTTPNTVAATNQLFTIGDACETQVAYIGKIGTAWHLLNVQHHETAIITSVSVGATAMTFARKLAWIPYPGEGVPISLVGATATSC